MNGQPIEYKQPRQSFFKHLLRSHMSIAVIGALALLIALATIFIQTRNARLLSRNAIPVFQASSSVLHGVQRSLAAMRGWVSLKDDGFVHEWYQVWDDEINPAVKELEQSDLAMDQPGMKKRVAALSLLLAELKESQWWVFDIAQTPGNEPAKVMHQFEADPILLTLNEIIRALLDAEKGHLSLLLHDAERNSLHDTGIYYYTVRELLQKIIFRGEVGLEDQYLYNLHLLKAAGSDLSQIISVDERFNALLIHFRKELAALERISAVTIGIRKSNSWNVSRHLMETETVPLAKKIIKVTNSLTRETNDLMTRQANLTTRIGNYATIGLSILLAAIILAAVVFSRNRAASLARPVITLASAANQMAAGTLTEDIPLESDDELGDLTRSFNTMRRELQESQRKMMRQEKMAAIGQLSGSVAHDIRNPLGAISNSIYFLNLISNEETDEKIREHISMMEHEINRANGIINDLLDFSRENEPIFDKGDLNELLQQVLARMDPAVGVATDLQLDEKLPIIAFDYSQMQRVVSNLVINANHAMPDGGTLQILTGHDDKSVWMAFRDTGHGMGEEDKRKIYEPLFTTKASGVGLGLSIVKDFIEKHHGSIGVESVVGKGTTFTVRLPILQNTEHVS